MLGFDFGRVHVGVAIGQTVTGTASPLGTLSRKSKPRLWEAIGDLVRTWQPALLVVGDPLNMDGTEQTITREARRFARQLEGRFSIRVALADERLSTVEARYRKSRPRPGRASTKGGGEGAESGEHARAAQVILESWFHDSLPRDLP